jgi:hypothetical protein
MERRRSERKPYFHNQGGSKSVNFFIIRVLYHINYVYEKIKSRDSAVGIVTGYRLDDREVGVQVPVGSRISLLQVVQTGSGIHTTSYTVGTVTLS